jgi:hypothetical protein
MDFGHESDQAEYSVPDIPLQSDTLAGIGCSLLMDDLIMTIRISTTLLSGSPFLLQNVPPTHLSASPLRSPTA